MTQEEKKPAGKALRARILKQSKKPLLILCIILAALYCCYQLYQWRVPSVKTEVAMEQSVYNAVDAEVFVVRDEYILSNTASGKVIPLVEDGKRVAKGDVVAMVFRNDEEAANYLRVRELDSQISHYQQLAKHLSSASDINALNEEAFSILLDSLDTAERSGYYISSTDGLEGVLPYGKIASVTQDMLQKALEAKAQPASGGVGKMVDSFDWYLLCAVDEKQALHFEQGDSIMVRMPFSAAGEFKAEVEHIAQSEDGKNLVTLKCNLMNETFANLRQETAQLVTNVTVYYAKPQAEEGTDEQEAPKPKQYVVDKGIRVSTSAVRVVDGEKGVYVRRGNVARFRKLNIVYSDQTYVISATASQDGEPIVDDPSNYLKQYDEVILEGKDLYDGKIIG